MLFIGTDITAQGRIYWDENNTYSQPFYAILDKNDIISKAKRCKNLKEFRTKYFREYIAIGGMPESVQKYIDTKDCREVDKVQRNLLQGYLYDIAHYATAEEKVKAEKCYLSLAKQLLDKENHKFADGNIGVEEDGIITLPLYMVAFI